MMAPGTRRAHRSTSNSFWVIAPSRQCFVFQRAIALFSPSWRRSSTDTLRILARRPAHSVARRSALLAAGVAFSLVTIWLLYVTSDTFCPWRVGWFPKHAANSALYKACRRSTRSYRRDPMDWRGIRKQLGRIIGGRRAWGWALAAAAALVEIVDWLSRAEGVASKLPWLRSGMIAAILASPWVPPALFLSGIGLVLVLDREPSKRRSHGSEKTLTTQRIGRALIGLGTLCVVFAVMWRPEPRITAVIEKAISGNISDGYPGLFVLATIRNNGEPGVVLEGYRLKVTLASGATATLSPAPIEGKVCFKGPQGEDVSGLEINERTALDNKTIRGITRLERGFLRFPSTEFSGEAIFAEGTRLVLIFADTNAGTLYESAPYVLDDPQPLPSKLELYCPGVTS